MVCKNCENCKHVHEPYESSICRSCDVTDPKVHLGRAKHTKWEPATDDDKKEEKKMDNRKTKAQLMEELEQKNTEIAALKKELERSENYELFVAAGKEMRDGMDGLVAGGLTEEQAFQILLAGAQLAARRRI